MSFESIQRPMTADERASLQNLHQGAPSLWKQAIENAGVRWAGSLLMVTLSWGLIGWLARRLFDTNIGWKSPVALWFLPVSVVCTLGYAIFSTLRWIKPLSATRQLGAGGEDALSSSFRPKSQLLLIRLPSTQLPLVCTFSGDVLPTERVFEITVPPERWPEDEEFIDVPWAELERRFSTAT